MCTKEMEVMDLEIKTTVDENRNLTFENISCDPSEFEWRCEQYSQLFRTKLLLIGMAYIHRDVYAFHMKVFNNFMLLFACIIWILRLLDKI